ncbi:MAG: methyl-accepting chemotaxis protein [Candidatus Aenigmatarchaeota archaeon]
MFKNQRRNYFIEKSFQTKFILKFCLVVLVSFFIVGVLLFFLLQNSTTVVIENTKVKVKTTADFILPILIQTLIVVSIFSAILVSLITLFVSHKIAGPLYRLKREIKKLESGDLNADFRIRSTDQLQDLASALKDMRETLVNNLVKIKQNYETLSEALNKSYEQKEQIKSKLEQLKESINFFKF